MAETIRADQIRRGDTISFHVPDVGRKRMFVGKVTVSEGAVYVSGVRKGWSWSIFDPDAQVRLESRSS